jgi:hypothetical protein
VILEVSATKQDGSVIFKQEEEYKNIGISRKGEPAAAAWVISSYSEEKSTAFRPLEVRQKTVKISLSGSEGQEIQVNARLYSYHGLPTEFGKPAGGEIVLQTSRKVRP